MSGEKPERFRTWDPRRRRGECQTENRGVLNICMWDDEPQLLSPQGTAPECQSGSFVFRQAEHPSLENLNFPGKKHLRIQTFGAFDTQLIESPTTLPHSACLRAPLIHNRASIKVKLGKAPSGKPKEALLLLVMSTVLTLCVCNSEHLCAPFHFVSQAFCSPY